MSRIEIKYSMYVGDEDDRLDYRYPSLKLDDYAEQGIGTCLTTVPSHKRRYSETISKSTKRIHFSRRMRR